MTVRMANYFSAKKVGNCHRANLNRDNLIRQQTKSVMQLLRDGATRRDHPKLAG
jgi:hypothetical protein